MSLAKRSILSSTYTISANLIMTIVQFARSIILARLIAPEIFGVYTYISSFVLITRSLPIFGMTSGLLHRVPESEGEIALKTHFTITLLFNCLWAMGITIAGIFLVDNEIRWMLWVILATQFADNLVQTSRTLLVKKVVFRRIALIELTSTLIATASALLLAWVGHGIWGLISTDIAAAVVSLFGYLIIRPPWKPKLGWSKKVVKYLINFGERTFVANLLGQALDNIDNLWTGRFLGNEALGFYSRAYTFATYPRKVLSTPINSVASGTYAELKNDHKRLSQAFFRVNAFLVRSSFLFSGILLLIAPEFIILLPGAKWLPMLTAFRLMIIYILLDPIKLTIANLFISIGKPEIVLSSRLVQMLVMVLGLFLLGNRYGIEGVAMAVNIMLLTGIVLLLRQARSYVQFSLRKMFLVPISALVGGIIATLVALQILGANSSMWLTAAIKLIVFSGIYILILALLEKDQLPILFTMLKHLPGVRRVIEG